MNIMNQTDNEVKTNDGVVLTKPLSRFRKFILAILNLFQGGSHWYSFYIWHSYYFKIYYQYIFFMICLYEEEEIPESSVYDWSCRTSSVA